MNAVAQQNNPMVPVHNYVLERLPSLAGFIKSPQHQASILSGLYANAKRVPALLQCDKDSIFMGVAYALYLDLPIGAPKGGVTLTPFKGKAVPIVDYRGMETIARRSGEVKSIKAVPVFEGEEFGWEEGSESYLQHVPSLDVDHQDFTKLKAVYAIAVLADGVKQWRVLSKKDVEFYRSKSPSGSRSDSPWHNFPVAMACKTAILRLCNDLPITNEQLRIAVESEVRREHGQGADDLLGQVIQVNPAMQTGVPVEFTVDMPTETTGDDVPASYPPGDGEPSAADKLRIRIEEFANPAELKAWWEKDGFREANALSGKDGQAVQLTYQAMVKKLEKAKK